MPERALTPNTGTAASITQVIGLGSFSQQESYSVEERYPFGQQERSTTISGEASKVYNDTASSFNLFDSSIGTLTSVGITGFYRGIEASLTVSDSCITQRFPVRTTLCSDSSSKTGRLDYGLNFGNISPLVPVITPAINSVNDEVLSLDYSFALGDSNTFTVLDPPAPFVFSQSTRTAQSTLDAFTGDGTASVSFASFWYETNSTTCTGNDIIEFGQKVGQRDIETCRFTSSLNFRGSAEVFIDYQYDPIVVNPDPDPNPNPSVVPLPAGLPLVLTGLGGFALIRRRQPT
ncbi:MAG: VPLPA-CTERM sorting domain-containing protein [Pseudomonadota bacterium]